METGIPAKIEAIVTALQPPEVFIRTAMAALITKMTVTINHTTEVHITKKVITTHHRVLKRRNFLNDESEGSSG